MNEVLFSSNKEDWETPIDFFNILDEEFHFSADIEIIGCIHERQ